MSAHYNPLDLSIYVGQRGPEQDGLYRIDPLGFSFLVAAGNNTAGLARSRRGAR